MTGSAFVVYWRDAGLGDIYVCESDRWLWGEPLMLHRTQRSVGSAGQGRAVSDLRSVIIAFCSQLGDLSDTR
ncbi:hypothetical protein GCM10008915_45480 [Bifidobacterium pullorum subsp. gallinarum]